MGQNQRRYPRAVCPGKFLDLDLFSLGSLPPVPKHRRAVLRSEVDRSVEASNPARSYPEVVHRTE